MKNNLILTGGIRHNFDENTNAISKIFTDAGFHNIIEDNKTGERSTYQIVGEYESNIENKKLSINSPMARGLIGKSKNDVVEIIRP